ncbi:MAG: PHP-associated domain-containing protein [Bacteroidales bacterium]|nr:PHP-associated domain-containing protein [Bacteroidales bacterium]
MPSFRADLHVHTVLSPCGDLEMSPTGILQRAAAVGLDMIAITDHNTTRQVKVCQKIGRDMGLFVLGGVEITTQEETHALAFFENDDQLDQMQEFLDKHLPKIPNDEDRFGYQLIVDENEDIVGEEPYLLLNAIDVDLDGIYEEVHRIGGLFVPAHVNKASTSLTSQLGFIPPDLRADALEINKFVTREEMLKKFAYLKKFTFITDSDAHFIHHLGEAYTLLTMPHRSFGDLRKALHGEEGYGTNTAHFRTHPLHLA